MELLRIALYGVEVLGYLDDALDPGAVKGELHRFGNDGSDGAGPHHRVPAPGEGQELPGEPRRPLQTFLGLPHEVLHPLDPLGRKGLL